jgi:hypothetical protein
MTEMEYRKILKKAIDTAAWAAKELEKIRKEHKTKGEKKNERPTVH